MLLLFIKTMPLFYSDNLQGKDIFLYEDFGSWISISQMGACGLQRSLGHIFFHKMGGVGHT